MPRLVLIPSLILLSATSAIAWSSRASRTEATIKHLDLAIQDYLCEHAVPPGEGEYWQHLHAANCWYHDELGPVRDQWGQPLVYRAPGRHGHYDIYSIGPDGTDNAGSRDDISNWAGVNPGYHYKRGRILGRITMIGSVVLAGVVYCIGFLWYRGIAFPLAGVVLSAGVPLGYHLMTMAGPPRFPDSALVGGLGAIFALLWGWFLVKAIANKPNNDSVIEEVHRHKDAIALEYGNDIGAYLAALRARQEGDRRVVKSIKGEGVEDAGQVAE